MSFQFVIYCVPVSIVHTYVCVHVALCQHGVTYSVMLPDGYDIKYIRYCV